MESEQNKKDRIKFEESVEVVMMYMAENHHPHTTMIINSTQAELLEGVAVHSTDKYLVDA